MSLISGFNPTGAVQGGVAGGQAGGIYGAIAGGVLGGLMGGGSGSGYTDPKASMRGYGLQAAGVPYAQAQLIKQQLKSGAMTTAQLTALLGGGNRQILGTSKAGISAPSTLTNSLVSTGAGGATSLLGTGGAGLNTLGQILAGAGAAAYQSLSPVQQAANNATALYQRLTGTTATGKKRRRMNPMNIRAARRAIRRIRSARKILMRIERSMPKARTHHRRTVR